MKISNMRSGLKSIAKVCIMIHGSRNFSNFDDISIGFAVKADFRRL